ncbi:MAG: O-antigen ligase family protein [Chloroflexota bacterium]|nr:O-antigen ligase family protein [Chloroflexota bacterium]
MSVAREPRSGRRASVGPVSPRLGLSRPAWTAGSLTWKATALALVGLVLVFTAPPHRLDLLLIGLAGLGGGLVWAPLAGPLLIGAALPVFFFSRQLAGPVSVSPPGLVLMLTWLAVLVNAARRKLAIRWPPSAYDLPVAAFLGAALLSLLVTEYPVLSIRELRALIFEPVLFFWLLLSLRGSPALALSGFLAGASLTALAAIAQVPLGIGGTSAEGVLRAQAWYPSANHLALMLGRAWPFLVAGALAGARWLWLPTGLVGLALLMTFSTGGWLGGVAGVLVVVIALGHRRLGLRLGGVAALALVLISVLAIAGVLPERLNPLRQTGGFRLDLWLSSLDMLRDHAGLGIGLDNFAYLYQQVYLREGAAAEPNLSHPHNWVLHVWLELGLLGLIAFVWLVVRFGQQARAALSASPSARWLVAGACGSMADLLVHGCIDNSYFLVDLAFVFWLTLALVCAEGRIHAR